MFVLCVTLCFLALWFGGVFAFFGRNPLAFPFLSFPYLYSDLYHYSGVLLPNLTSVC